MRDVLGQVVGVQADLQIWWTPDFPIVYISNPKSGCSTIKHSLKTAQAAAYTRRGKTYVLADDPHISDDCLRKYRLPPAQCRQRYLFSCVRNPFTRALSGFLDKVAHPDTPLLPDFGYRRLDDFEEYLRVLAAADPRHVNSHFRAQHINLDFPRISYDAIFFLENLSVMPRHLSEICPEFTLATFAPHSRGAAAKLRRHYTDRATDMVLDIFAKDFEIFGYSRKLEEAGRAPGKLIADGRLVPDSTVAPELPPQPAHAAPGGAFERALHYRRLIDMRII